LKLLPLKNVKKDLLGLAILCIFGDPMKSSFKCLYHLENDLLSILEIKQTDVPAEAAKSDIYKWLCYNKSSGNLVQLNFNSSDSSEDIQERYFEQGYLKFNQQSGTFIEKFNSAQHQLLNIDVKELSPPLLAAIDDYLSFPKN
jgi:hypothetical protein